MNVQDGKLEIARLIENYEKLSSEEREKYNEANTRKNFILPLFEALGWKTRSEEVSEEERTSGKRVDYAFKINGINRIFLEAKSLSIDLEELRWAEQAIWYAYHKSVSWVILTDFKSIKVFNADWDEQDAERSLVFEINYKDYLKDEKIWLLSRLAIEGGELDEYAEKEHKKPKRISVGEQLVADLLRWRDKLYEDFSGYNPSVDKKKIAENVQRILNRLIFIRTCEDRGFEENNLREMVRNWETKHGKNDELVNNLRNLFREFNTNYDSKLFEEKIIFENEKFITDDAVLAEVIKETYKSSRGVRWNFNDIGTDILGSVYEQYLGQVQASEKEEKTSKRKSQGIYYTPRYIVDYIVQSTLGELLKSKPNYGDSKIKILDPACGSGSFLIKAFEVLDDYVKKWKNQNDSNPLVGYARRIGILCSSIYGVDLDPEAIEIAQLNLLLKTLYGREKLPNLTGNIECGNSLISGAEKELLQYFGKNWKDKKPFNWGGEFPEVFEQGGFDIIIGNPPYIQSRNLNDEERHFYWNKYLTDTNHSDIYSFFIEKSIDLLKNKGFLGFIIPSTWLQTPSFKSLRKKIFTECKVLNILFFEEGVKVFNSAQVSSLVLILQKESNKEAINQNSIKIIKGTLQKKFITFNNIEQNKIKLEEGVNIFINFNIKQLLDKIFNKSTELNLVSEIIGGLRTGDDEKFLKNSLNNKDDKKLLRGRNIGRYHLRWGGEYVWYRPDLMKVKQAAAPKEAKFFETKEKLLVRMISGNEIIATYDDEGFYLLQDNLILPGGKYNVKYLLAILNSKLSKFIVKNTTSNIAITQSLLKKIPIYKINFSDKKEKEEYNELVELTDKILNFNKKLNNLDPILDDKECDELRGEIEKTDKKIDEEVYKLYGLSEEDAKIIERMK